MSQKTDLQSNNLDLQAILQTINNLPSAGSGGSGGGSVDTCTLQISSVANNNPEGPRFNFAVTLLTDSGVTYYNEMVWPDSSSTVTDVVCNTPICIISTISGCSFTSSGNVMKIASNNSAFIGIVVASNGELATIDVVT